MKKILLIVILLTISYNATIYYIDNYIANKDKTFTDSCSKVWSSRGLYNSHSEQNSITSIDRAFHNGYTGVEVDFYFDIEMKKFIVSHNKPQFTSKGKLQYTLKNGKLLTLKELFIQTADKHYFWLDYKNLDKLSSEDTLNAINRLDQISQIFNIKERIYIEGSNPFKLSQYTQNGFKTIFAFSPLKESSIFSSISSNIYKIAYYLFDITAIAMPYGDIQNPKYSDITQKNLKNIPTFLFHIPSNKNLIQHLIKNNDIKVLLIGRDKSLNYSQFNECQ